MRKNTTDVIQFEIYLSRECYYFLDKEGNFSYNQDAFIKNFNNNFKKDDDIDFLINVLSSYSKNKNKDNIIFNLAMSSISDYETYILPRMLANKKNNHSDLILFAQNEFKRIGTYEHNILTLKLSINFFIDLLQSKSNFQSVYNTIYKEFEKYFNLNDDYNLPNKSKESIDELVTKKIEPIEQLPTEKTEDKKEDLITISEEQLEKIIKRAVYESNMNLLENIKIQNNYLERNIKDAILNSQFKVKNAINSSEYEVKSLLRNYLGKW